MRLNLPLSHTIAGRVDPDDPNSIGAIVGLNEDNHRISNLHVELEGSGTDNVTRLATTSNVGQPGVWLFHVDQTAAIKCTFVYSIPFKFVLSEKTYTN